MVERRDTMNAPLPAEDDLADIRTRDASWTANYAHMHRSDGYGQAAADRRKLLSEVEQLRAQLAQCRAEYSACIDTVDRLENGPPADVSDDGKCWIKGCQQPKGHTGFCDPLPQVTRGGNQE